MDNNLNQSYFFDLIRLNVGALWTSVDSWTGRIDPGPCWFSFCCRSISKLSSTFWLDVSDVILNYSPASGNDGKGRWPPKLVVPASRRPGPSLSIGLATLVHGRFWLLCCVCVSQGFPRCLVGPETNDCFPILASWRISKAKTCVSLCRRVWRQTKGRNSHPAEQETIVVHDDDNPVGSSLFFPRIQHGVVRRV